LLHGSRAHRPGADDSDAGLTAIAIHLFLFESMHTADRATFGGRPSPAQSDVPVIRTSARADWLDHEAAPAEAVRETYLTRRSASETTFGEDKATITGAGDRTSGPVLRSGSPRLVIQEAWAWLTATQLVRAPG
jgi:hypothetical protein